MEDTFNTIGIVLNRQPWHEYDSRVIFYTRDLGKLELIARGTKKIKSKLAGHIEPVSLVNLMVVRGKQYDYVGFAHSDNSYINIKSDLDRQIAASQAMHDFNGLIKEGESDLEIYNLLKDFLDILNDKKTQKEKYDLMRSFFIFKLLALMGYAPELSQCIKCDTKILPNNSTKFDISKGGLVCAKCQNTNDKNQLTISDDCIKILRIIISEELLKIVHIKIDNDLADELSVAINEFFKMQK